jgi:NAD(P)-dependent dehydrogenase (short-subunit alcohol dehydrogenase family)
MKLQGKVAIVTGGGSGIGEATARLFAAEGAVVVIADKSKANATKVAKSIGGKASGVEVDVAKSLAVKEMIDAVAKKLGRIDILVNNAGYGITGSVVDTKEEDWYALMSVNINGVYHGCKHVIPIMAKQGGGVIINTASVTSRVGIKDRAAYVTSKGAVASMTRAMALDHVHQNIRINAIGPGTIETPYYQQMFAKSNDAAALREQLAGRQPMMRLGTPEEIAKAMLFLASDDSSFCTGTLLFADGGWTAR